MVESFNKILEHALTKVCNVQRNDWGMHVSVVLWAFRMTCKKLTGQTPFRLVYGIELVMPTEYIIPILRIAALIEMVDCKTLGDWLA